MIIKVVEQDATSVLEGIITLIGYRRTDWRSGVRKPSRASPLPPRNSAAVIIIRLRVGGGAGAFF